MVINDWKLKDFSIQIAIGTVWIRFKKRKRGSSVWKVYLEDLLEAKDRSYKIPLKLNLNTQSYGDFKAQCTCPPGNTCPEQTERDDPFADLMPLESREDYNVERLRGKIREDE